MKNLVIGLNNLKYWKSQMLFRKLEYGEDLEYRQWARENYKPLDPIKGVWHPVIQDECKMMNEQFYEKQSNS